MTQSEDWRKINSAQRPVGHQDCQRISNVCIQRRKRGERDEREAFLKEMLVKKDLYMQECSKPQVRLMQRNSYLDTSLSNCWNTKRKIWKQKEKSSHIGSISTTVGWLLIWNDGGQKTVGWHIKWAEWKILYPAKLPFRKESHIKTFLDKDRKSVASRAAFKIHWRICSDWKEMTPKNDSNPQEEIRSTRNGNYVD